MRTPDKFSTNHDSANSSEAPKRAKLYLRVSTAGNGGGGGDDVPSSEPDCNPEDRPSLRSLFSHMKVVDAFSLVVKDRIRR